ncbi:hypothetical protein LWI28_021513 [Acer negundo]|uniref:Legume lectin domain-containing protein n=1 Tax=Acer negundo TaxID=4023 RepID=A0AAD5NFE0_ACENE|nr:hypothetical protein LWI28_021513 [Acer negundo]
MGSFLLLFFFFFIFPVSVQSQNTSFFFEGFNKDDNNLDLQLGALIMSNPERVLRLTNKLNNVIGRAFYNKPIQMIDKTSSPNAYSFSTSFVFEIVPPSSGSGGHGLAFLLAPSTQLPGAEPGHFLGILSDQTEGNPSNHIFLVEFDTVNGFNEGVDMQGNHVGIGLNRIFSNKSEPTSYYVNYTDHKEDFPLEGSGPIQAWIEYDGVQKVVNVTVSPINITKPVKPLMSLERDLTGILNETMYAGFSASTGNKSSSHYILGWSFQLNGMARPLNVSNLPKPPPREKILASSDGKTVALISSLCVVTVLLMGLLGYFLLHRREEDSEIEIPKGERGVLDSESDGGGCFGGGDEKQKLKKKKWVWGREREREKERDGCDE